MKSSILAFILLVLIVKNANSQDTLYVYDNGLIVFKRPVSQIDSVVFNKPLNLKITDINGNIYTTYNFISAGNLWLGGGVIYFSNSNWRIYAGESPSGVANSLIFSYSGGASYYLGSAPNGSDYNFGFYVLSVSDRRIKKDILDIQNNKLLALEPKQYNLLKNNKIINQYGFIAQDVKEIMPELVETSKNCIADIYDYADYSSNVLKFNKDVDLNIGDKIKIILGDKNENLKNILDLNSDCDYIYADIKSVISRTEYTIDHLFTQSKVFVYGKQVNDFLSLDYNSIIALLVETTQKQEKRINYLEEILARNNIF